MVFLPMPVERPRGPWGYRSISRADLLIRLMVSERCTRVNRDQLLARRRKRSPTCSASAFGMEACIEATAGYHEVVLPVARQPSGPPNEPEFQPEPARTLYCTPAGSVRYLAPGRHDLLADSQEASAIAARAQCAGNTWRMGRLAPGVAAPG